VRRVSSNFGKLSQAGARSFSVRCPSGAWGRVRCGHLPGSIGILEAHEKTMPIGIAWVIRLTEGHLAVRCRRVHGAGIPRRSVIIDRRFVLARLCQGRTLERFDGSGAQAP